MKKIFKMLLLGVILGSLNGCFKRDDLEGANICTTVYPVEYITNRLYGNNSTIVSIYPAGVNPDDYELNDKMIKKFSEMAIFVYNGLTNEKQVARDLINKNKNIQIIDVSYGLKYNYGPEELWLSPNNYLMLTNNVKNNLQEFIKNKFIKEEIENNYRELEEELSLLDAEFRSVASAAKDNEHETIVVTDSIFKYLENYGFEIIDLSDDESEITNLENNFKNGTYKYILARDDKELNELETKLVKDYKAEVIKVEMMRTLNESQLKDKVNYLSIMRNYLENIKKIVLS